MGGLLKNKFGIRSASYVLGSKKRSLDDWALLHSISENEIRLLTASGVADFYDCPDESLVDLIISSTKSTLEKAGIDGCEIDLLLFANTRHSDELFITGHFLADLQHHLSLKNAMSFCLSQQNCASIISAIQIADTLMSTDPLIKNVLIVSGDAVPDDQDYLRTLDTVAIHSDGASSILLTKNYEQNQVLSCRNTYEGKYYLGDVEHLELSSSYALTAVFLLRKLLKDLSLVGEDVHQIFPNHVSIGSWYQILEMLKIPKKALIKENFSRVGHVFGNDWIINYVDRHTQGLNLTSIGFSHGLCGCYGAIVIK